MEGLRGVCTFLPVPAAELVPDLGPPGLPQQDLDEKGVFGVGRDHDLLDVRVRRALIPATKGKADAVTQGSARRWVNGQVGAAERVLTRRGRPCTAAGLAGYCPPVVSG